MLLKPYRVLDLTHRHGTLCAQILGDLGADVIQAEPPGGASGRLIGPFFDDRRDAEHSLSWWGYARGKRSVELDIDADREVFLKLVARADFLIEAEPVGSMTDRGIGYEQLREHNPALIHVSITPYGSSGPKSNWVASDITLVASAGPLAMTGDDDRPPVRVSVPQAWNHASAEAAAGALVALFERHQSGMGQHVDVSAQQSLTLATQGNILCAAINEATAERAAGGAKLGDLRLRLTFPASDGFVSITHYFGAALGPATRRLMEYVFEEGFCDAATRDKDWVEYGMKLLNGDEPLEEFERVKACVEACTASKTKVELLQAALDRRLLLAPMTTIEDVVNSEQFASRDYFLQPEGDGPAADIRYPGPFAKFGATPLARRSRPPRIGEHTQEVLEELDSLPPVSVPAGGSASDAPLAGLKVLDLMWALAGPGATRMLADFGATVIRVESSSRLDVCRTIRPFVDGDESSEKSAIFHTTNAGKRIMSLDLTKPEGREVILDLVRWADVLTESFSPRAMKAFGLDYATLTEINPNIIMLSTCLMGQTGPLSMFAGYGNLAAAVTGFYEITGWPDRDPAGPFGAYTDYIAPRYNAAAVLAAYDHFRRTGQAQHIDLAQAEAAMHFLTPAILDYTANGIVQSRLGNADPYLAPHGVYPTSGDDRHIAIACESDAHWRALCGVIPDLDFSKRELATAAGRLAHQAELDLRISTYTATETGPSLEARLQEAGVPASVVQNSPELVCDPQLLHLGHFITLPHQEGGETVIESSRIHLSRSPVSVDASAPTFNRDMMYVLSEVLGYDDERMGELLVAGVLE
jgi:crotonobetainyl-CoA:carnitine CoA-transferase CaiB-like acyl-CoA transferase|tara:strand:- start:5646 stop:8081 length:2436 start_codon:yes stop_codon:yes gene_type:complete